MNFDFDFGYVKNYVTDIEAVKANFFEVLKECFKFDGTLNRTKFWTYGIILGLVTAIVSVVIIGVFSLIPLLGTFLGALVSGLIGLVALVFGIGPQCRRLRDAGFNPLLVVLELISFICGLCSFIPLIGLLLGLVSFVISVGMVVLFVFPTKGAAAVVTETSEEVKQETVAEPENK